MKKSIIIMVAICGLNGVNAQKKTGDTSLPSSQQNLLKVSKLDVGDYQYSVDDYFKKPKQSSFKFSPDGKFLSFKQKDRKGKSHVYVKNTLTDKVVKVIEEKQELVRAYFWANNERLVFLKDKGGNENYHLYTVAIGDNKEKDLTPFEGVKINPLAILKEQKDYMIISMNKDDKRIFEPYKINITNGKLEKLLDNKDFNNPIVGYEFDKDGVLRGYTKLSNGEDYVLYYKVGQEFKDVITTNWKSTFSILQFNYESSNPNDAYVVTNLESDTKEIILYDLANKKVLKKIYSNPIFDVSSIRLSRKRNYEVDYYAYNGEKYQLIPVSKTYKRLVSKFKKKFGDKDVHVTSVTDNEDKYLLYVTSDKLYGVYYMYNTEKDSFKELFNLMPTLKEIDMAEMRPIKFKSRDGLTLYGYLTIPKQSKSKNVPLIVNPHGGPYGPRDSWGFNPETQLFASRGYATLQVNYRGSGGYGNKFSIAGYRQVGRKMLDDLEDGVAYVKSLGFVNNKIAIYGASYGGLATLGSLVKTPDLYTCGVDYVGVSNLFTFYKSIPPYWKAFMKQIKEQWYQFDNEEDKALITAVSPALNTDKITKPLFVVQGANDPRVNIDESDQIVRNLRARNVEVPYMVKYNEGHGFGHEDNKIELYSTMMGFFSKHLK